MQFAPIPMAKILSHSAIVVLLILSLSVHYSEQLQASQAQTLVRIQSLLNYPSFLKSWNKSTDFCNTESSSSLTVVCYGKSITQLHIIGNTGVQPLPKNFSIDSFFATLVTLPNLKVLTLVSLGLFGPLPRKIAHITSLEIFNISSNFLHGAIPEELSTLTNLQTLILDDNMFTGRLPDGLSSLSVLTVLSLKKNSLNGSLPHSLGDLQDLRVLALSHNHFLGEVPDLSDLTNLQVLDLEDNSLGPRFPLLGSKIVKLILKRNRFSSRIPDEMSSYYQLHMLDLSFNRFVGPFPPSLLSLPSITYLDISGNRFTGVLFENLSCNAELEFVDLSSNLLSGSLPKCLVFESKKRVVLSDRNCFVKGDRTQHPLSFCQNQALAVGILPHHRKPAQTSKAVVALSLTGGIIGGIALVGAAFFVVRRVQAKKAARRPPTRFISVKASTGYTSKLLSDARYVSQAMKLGALGLPAYRTFSLEELEEATDNFNTSAFMGEGSHGQMYRGMLKDGSFVAIRCLKMKRSHSTQSFMQHLELTSKLRHRHLVTALGHCFECYLDDSSVSRIFLVFEYVPNGTLRSWISEARARQTLPWTQRVAVAIGVANGIQFLHTGIVPGVYSNNLKITDILLDQNFVAKISSYNLPLLSENTKKVGNAWNSVGSKEEDKEREKYQDRNDIYDFGVILLETIVGRPVNSIKEVDLAKNQMETSLSGDDATRRKMVDPTIQNTCSDESLRTLMEICMRCLHKNPEERASIEDVLWNLQFAAQVQDAWRGDSHSSDQGSPISPTFRIPCKKITIR